MRRGAPLVSVGIPFFNNRETLGFAIRSVFAQGFRDWELILIDDGSRDGSSAIAEAVKDPRVRVFRHTNNKGLAARLNEITRVASGEYIARMDADDLMHPRRLEAQLEFLERQPETDVVGSAMYITDRRWNIVGWRGRISPTASACMVLRNKGLFAHPTVMGRRTWFTDNPYDETAWCWRAEDYELWIRTCHKGRYEFGYIPNPLLFYCEVGNFNFEKYRASMRGARAVVRRYGPHICGSGAHHLVWLRLCAQEGLYGAASRMGLAEKLVLRRTSALSRIETLEASRVLETARTADVPGLDVLGAIGSRAP